MKTATPKWESEAAMLVAFMAEARAMGFRVVPEACGHDLVLVVTEPLRRPPGSHRILPDVEVGDVIAVEGKLRASITLLRQVTPPFRRRWGCTSPATADFYAAVIPGYDSDFEEAAHALGAAVWVMRPGRPKADRWDYDHAPILASFDLRDELRCVGYGRLAVPDLDVDITPGCPSPRQVTAWKIAAVRLCLLGLTRELVNADFVDAKVNRRRFVDSGWVTVRREGRVGFYILADVQGRPDRVYPEIVAAIEAQGAPPVVAAAVPRGPLFASGGTA